MAIKSSVVTVAATATLLFSPVNGSVTRPRTVIVRNSGAASVFLGGADVLAATGMTLAVGSAPFALVLVAGDDLYAITASGTVTVEVLRTDN